jgi:hypothetical protein
MTELAAHAAEARPAGLVRSVDWQRAIHSDSTGQILDMLLLGACQGITPEVLVDLITVLAPREGGMMKWWTGAP